MHYFFGYGFEGHFGSLFLPGKGLILEQWPVLLELTADLVVLRLNYLDLLSIIKVKAVTKS